VQLELVFEKYKSMKRKLLSTAILLLALSSYAASPTPQVSENIQEKRIEFLRDLEHKHLVLTTNCEDFTNFILTNSGLPKLGKDTPVVGERLDLDRGGEKQHPPTFIDGVRLNKPDTSVQIRANTIAGTRNWVLNVERTYKFLERDVKNLSKNILETDRVIGKTTFLFQVREEHTKEVCALQSIDFSQKTEKSHLSLKKTLHAEDCVDVLTDKDISSIDVPQSVVQIGQVILHKDCMTGIHYFDAVKQMLLADEKKQRMGGK
jgi:hypothetical protein